MSDADYAADALFANDSWATSIMSYFSNSDNGYFQQQNFSDIFALTPMSADIVAMQQLYGLSTTTRAGNTTYGFNSNAGRAVYDATMTPDAAFTIFDMLRYSYFPLIGVALVAGGLAAGFGIAFTMPAATTAVHETVTIPMRKPVESLNVAMAAALVLYEAMRQREG